MSDKKEEKACSNLPDCVVSIWRNGQIAGTGFFVSKSGDILTCFHVINPTFTENPVEQHITVKFQAREYECSMIFASPQPKILDFAILRLTDDTLPEGVRLIPLGLGANAQFPHPFLSYGFRAKYLDANGAYAKGEILGPQQQFGVKQWQLNSESDQNQQMRSGMSGAPIYDVELNEINGMFFEYSREDEQENIPLAISLESIAVYWQPLEKVLKEQDLWQQLKKAGILKIGGDWFTSGAFQNLYQDFFRSTLSSHLKPKCESDLLEKLRETGTTQEFIDYISVNHPLIPIDQYIHVSNSVCFLNREDEKKAACESLAAPYIFFEGPMGYGKTKLLDEIRKEHFRAKWLCISLESSDKPQSTIDLLTQIYNKMDIDFTLDSSDDIQSDVIRVANRIEDLLKEIKGIGVLFTLDNAEKISLEIVKPFFQDFLHRLATELRRGGKQLRLRVAGRYSGVDWAKRLDPIVIRMMSPFEIKYVEEAVKSSLPKQKFPALYAANLMYASAGHPYCMAEGIKKIGDAPGDISSHFALRQDELKGLIHSIADEVRKSMQQDFKDIAPLVEKLSIFPLLNRNMLGMLMNSGYIKPALALDKFKLEELLPSTRYYNLKDNCLSDHISRRVLVADFRASNPARYKQRCRVALDLYRQYIQNFDSHLDLMLLAALELELALMLLSGVKEGRKSFFAPGGILEKYKNLLDEKNNEQRKEIVADLHMILVSEKQKEEKQDGEFRFLLNFCLSDGDYSNGPFEEFVNTVQIWKQDYLSMQ